MRRSHVFVTYANGLIMSMAKTELDAIASCVEDTGQAWEEVLAENSEYTPAGVAPCTDAFAAEVEELGGLGRSWDTLPDGRICTIEEADEPGYIHGRQR